MNLLSSRATNSTSTVDLFQNSIADMLCSIDITTVCQCMSLSTDDFSVDYLLADKEIDRKDYSQKSSRQNASSY